jgi:hypothetical protein
MRSKGLLYSIVSRINIVSFAFEFLLMRHRGKGSGDQLFLEKDILFKGGDLHFKLLRDSKMPCSPSDAPS